MSSEQKAAFERIWDGVWHSPDAARVIAENYAADFQMHIAPVPQPLDRDALIGFVATWQKAFPDGRMEILDVAVQDDKVWCTWVSTGTHSDTYLDVPATGKAVRYEGADVFRFAGGKIVECHDLPDALSLLRQLGALPG